MTGGIERRLRRILPRGTPAFMLPIDDALIAGPTGCLTDPRDPVRAAVEAGAQSVMGYPGALRRCIRELQGVAFIQNLTGSTTLSHHTRKVIVASVGDAVRNGADGVAAHINFSADEEPEMLSSFGRIADECRRYGMPLLAMAYPRRADTNGVDDNYTGLREGDPSQYSSLVARCARAAAELGADLVKVPYTGSTASFASVVEAVAGTPVLVAGGVPVCDDIAIANAADALRAGAAGVSFGRQTWLREAAEVGPFVSSVLQSMRSVMPNWDRALVGDST